MINRNKRLPADADANRSDEDVQNKHQEEFDDESKLRLDKNARKQDARNEQREDSQLKHEDKIQPEKKKQSEKWDKVDRKLPNIKK